MNGLEFFGIGLPELVTILIIAGLVMGPARIAKVARQLGQWTAQLQNISRGFMQQLSSELDAAETADLKEAMQELRDLREELTSLRSEMSNTAKDTTKQLQEVAGDMERSIRPPNMDKPKTAENGQANGTPKPTTPAPNVPQPPEKLPNILEVDDDPDS